MRKSRGEPVSSRKSPYLGLFAVFLLTLLISAFAAENPSATLYQTFRFLTCSLLVYVAMSRLLTDTKRLEFVISASIGCFSVMSGFAVIEYLLEDNFIFHTLLHQPMPNLSFYRVYRAYSTTALPNVLACLNVTLLPLIVYRMHTEARPARKWLYGSALALELASLYCTMSRTSWLALALIALLYLAFRRNKLRTLSLLAAAALFVWGFVLPGLQGSAAAEKLSLRLSPEQVVDTGSYWHRMYKFKSAELILEQSPLFGIGFGNYPLVSGESRYLASGDPNALNTFDNTYLKIVAETGLVGLMLFLLLIGAVIFSVVRGLSRGGALPPLMRSGPALDHRLPAHLRRARDLPLEFTEYLVLDACGGGYEGGRVGAGSRPHRRKTMNSAITTNAGSMLATRIFLISSRFRPTPTIITPPAADISLTADASTAGLNCPANQKAASAIAPW